MTSQRFWLSGLLIACSMIKTAIGAPEIPTVAYTMSIVPSQKDVEFETPKAAEFPKCKVDVERKGKVNGWVVTGPAGQVLRKFLDTDGDGNLDQFRFFNQGIEVYRDIDSNHNKKIDQCRWLNLGGSRWGVDLNEDGRIDQWKVLTAAEASREAIRAMTAGDEHALRAIMITAEDLKYLGVHTQLSTRLLESAADPGKNAKNVMAKSKVLTSQSRWSRFEAQLPGTIPQDEEKANADLQVYESAMAIIETDNNFHAVQIGEVIRVGEVWKLTQVPLPIEGKTITTNGGILIEPLLPAAPVNTVTAPRLEKILNELQDNEKRLSEPTNTPAQIKTLISKRNSLFREAIEAAESDEDKTVLMKQMIDDLGINAMSKYPAAVEDLKGIESELVAKSPKSILVPYVTYRLMQAENSVNSQKAGNNAEKQADVLKNWMQQLESFIDKFPSSDDADDAMLTLANHEEYQGHTKQAIAWYQRLIKERPKAESVGRAHGALLRLNLNGQPLALAGPALSGSGTIDAKSYRGQQVVLVVFWASGFERCEEDVPQLRALYQDNKAKGFEIIGISLDPQKATAQAFVQKNKMSWPQIFEPAATPQAAGMSSPLATKFGIISVPTMFLVDKDGKVVNQNAMMDDVKSELPDLLKGTSNVAVKPSKN